jgi:transcriptional regulator with XRE-family HTH domain
MGSTLGQRLRTLRIEHGLSQADLAGDLVSPSYVSLIEADRRSPERDVLDGLARRLGCSSLYLESGIAPEQITELRLKLQFAKIAQANGSLAEARSQFRELTMTASGEIRHDAIWGLARTEEALGNLHESLTALESLLGPARLGEPGSPGLLALHNARCRIYREAGDLARSIEVGEAALREVRELGLEGTEHEIRLTSTLVGSYQARGDLFSAERLASQVICRAERLGNRESQGRAYWNAAVVAAARGELPVALELATKTLALLSESAPDRYLAGMRVTYAWLLLRCDPPRLAEADSLLAQAHSVLADLSASPELASCTIEMARSALLRGELQEAIRIADEAITICPDQAAEVAWARVISGLALVLSGEPQRGSAAVAEAAGQLAAMSTPLDAAQAWRELGEALAQVGELAQAVNALRRAADCAGAQSTSVRAALPAPRLTVAVGD